MALTFSQPDQIAIQAPQFDQRQGGKVSTYTQVRKSRTKRLQVFQPVVIHGVAFLNT
jgi:hypothetical protein